MNLGSQAKALHLPAAGFAQISHIWMVFLVLLSFLIPLPKLSRAVWLTGIACMAFAPVLLFSLTKTIPLSRWLASNEYQDFRRQFAIPVVQYSATGEGPCLRVRNSDDSAPLEAYLDKLGVLRTKGGNWEGKWKSP